MSVENLNAIRDWAILNQAAMPDATLRLVFATDLAKSVIEQESAPDPQRVIEIGYDISSLMWRIRMSVSGGGEAGGTPAAYAAGTRVILHALRQGMTGTGAILGFIEARVGKTVDVGEVIGHDDTVDMPEFGFRRIAVALDGGAYSFCDQSENPCRPSKIKNLSSAISKARKLHGA
jgi:hypothetical protein